MEGEDRTYCDHQDIHMLILFEVQEGLHVFVLHLVILSVTTTSLSNEGALGFLMSQLELIMLLVMKPFPCDVMSPLVYCKQTASESKI